MGIKVELTINGQVWKLWGARVKTEIDPVSGLNILILSYLEIDGVRVADYGLYLTGDKAISAYNSWSNHTQLYEMILRDVGIDEATIATIPNMDTEFSEWELV